MRRILTVAACLIALPHPVDAQALQGRWNVASPAIPGYEGIVLIDAQNRATWSAPEDNGRAADFLGYIRFNDTARVELLMTDHAVVIRVDCSIASRELLRCRTSFPTGKTSPIFTLTRVGAAPPNVAAPP